MHPDPSGSEPGAPAAFGPPPTGLLEAFLPEDRRDALARGVAIDERATGAALFADISGFTPLTESLVTVHGPQRGAEELNRTLNLVYQEIIGDLAARGGVVVYLSGDAITCWLDGDDGSRAVQVGLDMQQTMASTGRIRTAEGEFTLGVKVAVAVGQARRFVVGDPSDQLMDVLAGRLIDQLAAAEGLTNPGEVVAEQSVLDALGERLVCSEIRQDPDVGRRCGVVVGLTVPPEPVDPVPLPSLPLAVVRPWLLPDVFDRLMVGGGRFLAEIRPAHPIFIRFAGFDFDDDPAAPAELDRFIRAVQEIMVRHDGTLLGITVGDKGAYLNAVLGAPRSHEDDAQRAVLAALAIRDLEGTTAAVDLQVGVSTGRTYTGTYGHTDRRTLSVQGDPTNVAARLMSKAPPGQVYVLGEVADEVEDHFDWDDVPPLTLKGKSAPVRVRIPLAVRRHKRRRVRRFPLPMVGRDRELAVIDDLLDRVRAGERQVVAVAAEAGIGKSRFVAEVLRHADRADLRVAYGQAESLGRTTSYLVWREVWQSVFGLDPVAPDAQQAARIRRTLASIDPALVPRLPLTATVLDLDLPDNDLVASFDAKLRKASLENLLGDVLVHQLRQRGPLLVVLEDLHWVDPLSVELLEALVRRTDGLPVLFLLAYRRLAETRPAGDGPDRTGPEVFAGLPGFTEIGLGDLDDDGIRSVAAAKVAQVFGPDVRPAEALLRLVVNRAQGNPFYAEELVNYVRRREIDPSDTAAVSDLQVPDSLQAMVLTRIDGLAEQPRQTVKVASVVGREFRAPMLSLVHSALGDAGDVSRHLGVARDADLVIPEIEAGDDWLFRHILTREVAYESTPFAVRATLHEHVGDAVVATEGEATNLDLLAHHYWHSGNDDKKRRFLRAAGDAARQAYANDAAIEHYGRLASVTPEADRATVLLDLAGVLELAGSWDRAETTASDARHLAETAGDTVQVGWCDVALAEIARKSGRYDDAVNLLGRAEAAFEAHGDRAGAARALHLLGTVAAQQGDLGQARDRYEASRAIRAELGDVAGLAALLSNLGVVANYEGDYDAAIAYHQESLDLRRQTGDRWAIAVSYTNLGIVAVGQQRYAEAHQLFLEAMRLNREVGDVWMVAIAHNNLGNALRGLRRPDEARSHYAEAMATYRQYNDRWALAFLLEDIAALAAADADPVRALEVLGAADRLREAIEAPRPESQTAELAEWLDPAVAALDDASQEEARNRGRSRSEDEGLDHAAAWCGPPTS